MNKVGGMSKTAGAGWSLEELGLDDSMIMSDRGRAMAGAFYGLVVGTAYALLAATIDAILLRDVPMRLNWPAVWASVAATGAGGALLGAVAAWPSSALRGIIIGALAMASWGILRAVIVSGINPALVLAAFLPTFLPTAMVSLPIVLLLRGVVALHESFLEKTGRDWLLSQAGLLIGLIALGLFVGSWAQMPPYAQDAVRRVNRMVSGYLSGPADAPVPLPLSGIPNLRARVGKAFTLEQSPAASGVTAVEVGVIFDNGYTITCLINGEGALPSCLEGLHMFSGHYDSTDQR